MSILTSDLPSTVTINNKQYPIVTDYGVWLDFSKILEEKTTNEEAGVILFNIAGSAIEDSVDPQDLFRVLIEFFIGEDHTSENETSNKKNSKTYDFEHDAQLIYAAFLQTYGIDLIKYRGLHWWCFRALLNALTDDNKFMKVIGYRSIDISKIKDKEQRKHYRILKKMYTLAEHKTQKQKDREFEDNFIDFFI